MSLWEETDKHIYIFFFVGPKINDRSNPDLGFFVTEYCEKL